MTDPTDDTGPPSLRLMCDGGREPTQVTKVRRADGVVTREVDGDEQEMLRVPISSTRSDREGDEFDKAALEKMADQIRVEQPMVFDNHGLAGGFMSAIPYDSRETIGAQMDAELESAEDSEWDLYALVNPDATHPEGERMAKQVRDEGQPLKFSVGFRVTGYDEKEDDNGNVIGRIFTDADLMETSRVGIPANPDASVTQSVTSKGNGGASLPGYANHPMVQMMQMMGGGENVDAGTVTKDGRDAVTSDTVDDGTPVEVDGGKDKGSCESDGDCPDGEVCEDGQCVDESEASASVADVRALREDIDDLRDAVSALVKEEGDPCDDNGDCGEGMVCVDGECVPEDDGEEESSTDEPPDAVKQLLEEQRELRDEIEELRESGLERGDAETGETDMTETAAETNADESDDEKSGSGLLFD